MELPFLPRAAIFRTPGDGQNSRSRGVNSWRSVPASAVQRERNDVLVRQRVRRAAVDAPAHGWVRPAIHLLQHFHSMRPRSPRGLQLDSRAGSEDQSTRPSVAGNEAADLCQCNAERLAWRSTWPGDQVGASVTSTEVSDRRCDKSWLQLKTAPRSVLRVSTSLILISFATRHGAIIPAGMMNALATSMTTAHRVPRSGLTL